MMPEPADTWEERCRRFGVFKSGVFNILKVAHGSDITPDALAQIKRDVTLILDPEVQAEMKAYTDTIEIRVDGGTNIRGWWWGKKTKWKRINVEVTFDPYRMHLSTWTDPTAPDGVCCFE